MTVQDEEGRAWGADWTQDEAHSRSTCNDTTSDYDKVFVSVSWTDSVRLTIAIAAHEGWHCNRGTWGMISAPHGRRVNHFWTATCKRSSTWSSSRFWHHQQGAQCAHAVTLRKTLYILHQTPRAWKEKRVDDILMSFGFRRSLSKHAIYIRWNDDLQMAISTSTNQFKRTLILYDCEGWC